MVGQALARCVKAVKEATGSEDKVQLGRMKEVDTHCASPAVESPSLMLCDLIDSHYETFTQVLASIIFSFSFTRQFLSLVITDTER